MKHYKIINFIKIIDLIRHEYITRRVGGQETGDYFCETLNDTKTESDFCCEQNAFIQCIKCMDTNRVFEIGKMTNSGNILEIKLKKGRGMVRVSNSPNIFTPINTVIPVTPIIQQPVNNEDMSTVKKKTASATKTITKASAPSRSQMNKESAFKEIESQINKCDDLRLNKFYKKDLPLTVKEFLINFFTNYNNNHSTIYVNNKKEQTSISRRRSLGDIYKICKYYYPDVTLDEVVKLLFKDLQKHFKEGFRHSYCSVIKKRVFYYNAGTDNLESDANVDEYGKLINFYKSKI